MLSSVTAVAVAFTAPAARPGFAAARAATPAMQFFGGGKGAETLPKGWKKVKSRSRPGQFSYLNEKNGQVYDSLPASLMRRTGSEFFDDEKDTTAKPFWQLDLGGGDKSEGTFEKARGFFADKTSNSELEAYYKKGKKTDGYVESSGFAANGEDLATVGGIYYLATVPFLLFFLAYVFGGIGSPYGGGGNFR